MKVETVRSHLVNLEMLAMQNGGNRALGTPGYKAVACIPHLALVAASLDTEH